MNEKSERAKIFRDILFVHKPHAHMFKTISGVQPFSTTLIVDNKFKSGLQATRCGVAFHHAAQIIIASVTANQILTRDLPIYRRAHAVYTAGNLTEFYHETLGIWLRYLNACISKNHVQSTLKLAQACCFLSHTDTLPNMTYIRQGICTVYEEDSEVVNVLKQLLDIFLATFIPACVKVDSTIKFSPTFSDFPGSAKNEADVCVDNFLVDFKTSMYLNARWSIIAQIWFYYLMNELEHPHTPYTKIGFYHARYGETTYIDLDTISSSVRQTASKDLKWWIDANRDAELFDTSKAAKHA